MRFKKPRADGSVGVTFSPMESMHRLAALVPPPGFHCNCYHGVRVRQPRQGPLEGSPVRTRHSPSPAATPGATANRRAASALEFVETAGAREAVAQIVDLDLRDVDREWPDFVGFGHAREAKRYRGQIRSLIVGILCSCSILRPGAQKESLALQPIVW